MSTATLNAAARKMLKSNGIDRDDISRYQQLGAETADNILEYANLVKPNDVRRYLELGVATLTDMHTLHTNNVWPSELTQYIERAGFSPEPSEDLLQWPNAGFFAHGA